MDISLQTEQKQILSQKMIQSASILQMSAAQLGEYLNEQSLENPVLELTERPPEQFEEKNLEKYQWICSHDEQNRYLYQKVDSPEDEPPEWNQNISEPESLRDHLWSQLLTKHYPSALEPALRFLLESLDARGYFTDPLPEFADRFFLTPDRAKELLALVQSLEPAGIGAVNLKECLCLQLERSGQLTDELREFIRDHLTQMAKNQLPAIAASMKLPLETVKEFCETVRGLNPKPGALYSDVRQLSYIVPDVIVVRFQGHFDLLLNESLCPDISFSSEYMRMYQEQPGEEVKNYLLDKIHQVEWLKQCVAQRNKTLFSVVSEILAVQQDFFRSGPAFLKPLRLCDVADTLGIHESTVSRAVHEKYLQCSWGIFPLSSFFAKAAVKAAARPGVLDNSGDSAAATVSDIKKVLVALIAQEDKKKPCSDRILSELLTARGFPISRRTVAKYREEEQIPGASGRKQY